MSCVSTAAFLSKHWLLDLILIFLPRYASFGSFDPAPDDKSILQIPGIFQMLRSRYYKFEIDFSLGKHKN